MLALSNEVTDAISISWRRDQRSETRHQIGAALPEVLGTLPTRLAAAPIPLDPSHCLASRGFSALDG